MSTERVSYGLITYDSKLYAMGGYNIHGRLNSAETYDTQTNTWKSVASMIIIRDQFDAALMNNSIYACGGINVNVFKFCEYYSFNDQWYEMVSMNTERRGLALVAHEGLLYAIGGYNDKNGYLNSVERYDTYSNKWTEIKPMLKTRYMFGSASFMGNIYVCGGEGINGSVVYESCETYNPKTNQWTPIASMITGRRYFKLIVFNDILYALGGQISATNITETVEVYDYNSNKWYYTQSLPDKLWGYGAAVITKT
ncbi:kelch-like protein 17 [Oppia nitens]|uniref:kelch-like protein 17 n=1 Tax=Oppia nitens TaxID=1686743 RepID=UPI0023DA4D90|nr:kelch-like protein 17 [Oppia nitens]